MEYSLDASLTAVAAGQIDADNADPIRTIQFKLTG